MSLTANALRLTVFVGENDTWHHRPVFTEIVHRAHAAGLAGASVFRGVEGFGASSLIHTARLLSVSEDLPVAVVIVDAEEAVRGFLPQLDELVGPGLVVLEEVEVVRHLGQPGPREAPGRGDGTDGSEGPEGPDGTDAPDRPGPEGDGS